MKQSTTQWAREAINNIQSNLIKRAREGTLSNSDQQMMTAMMADIQKELESQTGVNEAIQALYDNLENIQKELSIPIDSEGAARIERTASEAERNLNELEKVEHIANALQLDAQSIIPLRRKRPFRYCGKVWYNRTLKNSHFLSGSFLSSMK